MYRQPSFWSIISGYGRVYDSSRQWEVQIAGHTVLKGPGDIKTAECLKEAP